MKGGDFRSREANVYRLAELSVNIIDQCAAQGVPFAREYGGTLANRSFGGALVSRTFYARGQTGQQLLLGAYQALERQVAAGTVTQHPRTEMLELVVVDGRARGIVVRDLVTGRIGSFAADAVVLATGGYGNVFYLSTNAKGSNATAIWRAHRKGALFANPCYTQIHPTCIPRAGAYQSKLTLMSESLRNDGRVWVPRKAGDGRRPEEIPDAERDYYLERMYPTYGNLAPRDISSRAAKTVCDEGRGVGPGGLGVYLDFRDAFARLGRRVLDERYGNLFEMYERITGDDPHTAPMRIYPAVHYTMGGLWVDYDLMSTIPGLFVAGEANFSDHGANRLGASALMQGLADGYFIVPYTVGDYIAHGGLARLEPGHPAFVRRGAGGRGADAPAPLNRRDAAGRPLPPRARRAPVGGLRHGADAGEPHPRPRDHPAHRGGVLARPARDRLRRGAEPGAREGRARRRLLRARRAPVLRRAPPERVGGRPLPRRVPDARTARRPGTTPSTRTSRRGSGGGRGRRPRSTRSRSTSSTYRSSSAATSEGPGADPPRHLAAARRTRPRPVRAVRGRGRRRSTCRSSRCSTC